MHKDLREAEALLRDLRTGQESGLIAARFHRGLAEALAGVADRIAGDAGTSRIALSGGVMQNRLLLRLLHTRLSEAGHDVRVHRQAPANDGGLALGQATIAAVRI